MTGALLAVSDLHLGHSGNRAVVEEIEPTSPDDWLIVAGDVGEKIRDIRWALSHLRSRFERVIWVPGNHELWTVANDDVQLRGESRYQYLVEMCRDIDVVTPEDEYPIWPGCLEDHDCEARPMMVAPLFTLYDYSFLPRGAKDRAEGLAAAERANAVATDEHLLKTEPYRDAADWCDARIDYTGRRLAAVRPDMPLILVNHFPLRREPTRVLLRSEFALWCGTERTACWHREYNVACVVYGHLHIRRTDYFDGVRFEEVSLGYPREWKYAGPPDPLLTQIIPRPHEGVTRGGRGRAVRLRTRREGSRP
ncbi:metallophosphoesterase family protein [Nocardia sp. Marseille-Q1738]